MKKCKITLKRINKILCDLAFCYTIFYLLLFLRPMSISISICFITVVLLYFGISILFFKRTVFYSKQKLTKKSLFIILSFVLCLFVIQIFWQSRDTKQEIIINKQNIAIPISLPTTYYYANQINIHKQNPYNYIMRLFDKYDIVILAERLHPEYKQWDFFSKVILNDTFAVKVKNVYTEFGNVNNQVILDTFLNTKFETLEELQRATASIVRENGGCWAIWINRNIFDFLINLHNFNINNDSLEKIKLYFSDLATNWNKLQYSYQWDSIENLNRDSLMAYNIINQYIKDSAANKKMLIIMNTRHAWKNYVSTANYIYEKFPNSTANILINGSTQDEFMKPMSLGCWDEAAKKVKDTVWAIDFSECPLGNLRFDLTPYNFYNHKYKDIFTGMIYYLHPNKWKVVHNYPYILDNYKDTLLRRSAVIGDDYLQQMEKNVNIDYYSKTQQSDNVFDIELLNFKFLVFHILVLLFLSTNLLVLIRKK